MLSHHKKHKLAATPQAEPTTHSRHSKHHLSSKVSSKHTAAHKGRHVAAKPRPRYAYPMGFFLMEPPTFDSSPLPDSVSSQIKKAFYAGYANDYPTRSLVRTGIVSYYPMRGGIFWRREPIKYLVMHSTEPGIPVGARTIIDGWSHGGRRHAGAHYVIERDGTIYQAVDPDLGTIHLNVFKTLPGINNDNCVGVEMCHQGSQDYPPALMESAARLATYLQNHYHISDANIITHRYAQQGDHTDPVNFNWDSFIAQKESLENQGLNQKLALLKTESLGWQQIFEQPKIIVVDKKPLPVEKKPAVIESSTTIDNKTTIDKKLIPTVIENKAVILDRKPMPTVINTPPVKPVVSKLVPTESNTESKAATKPAPKVESKTDFQVVSPFEAKFGPISQPEVEATYPIEEEDTKSAPLPSKSAPLPSNSAPPPSRSAQLPSSSPKRLMPIPTSNRLVPMQIIINTQPTNNQPSADPSAQNSSGHSRLIPSTQNNNKPRILPLRGPIDMDPEEAESLLNQ